MRRIFTRVAKMKIRIWYGCAVSLSQPIRTGVSVAAGSSSSSAIITRARSARTIATVITGVRLWHVIGHTLIGNYEGMFNRSIVDADIQI
jgi:hypothetical protein